MIVNPDDRADTLGYLFPIYLHHAETLFPNQDDSNDSARREASRWLEACYFDTSEETYREYLSALHPIQYDKPWDEKLLYQTRSFFISQEEVDFIRLSSLFFKFSDALGKEHKSFSKKIFEDIYLDSRQFRERNSDSSTQDVNQHESQIKRAIKQDQLAHANLLNLYSLQRKKIKAVQKGILSDLSDKKHAPKRNINPYSNIIDKLNYKTIMTLQNIRASKSRKTNKSKKIVKSYFENCEHILYDGVKFTKQGVKLTFQKGTIVMADKEAYARFAKFNPSPVPNACLDFKNVGKLPTAVFYQKNLKTWEEIHKFRQKFVTEKISMLKKTKEKIDRFMNIFDDMCRVRAVLNAKDLLLRNAHKNTFDQKISEYIIHNPTTEEMIELHKSLIPKYHKRNKTIKKKRGKSQKKGIPDFVKFMQFKKPTTQNFEEPKFY